MVAHPYRGIIHDARFYMVQALNVATEGVFNSDLFFAYGSQDSFTVFTPFYRLLVEGAGPGLAHAIASAVGQALWFGALVALMTCLFANRGERFAAALAVVLLDRNYGASGVFTYAEGFVTPRLFAEAFVLGAGALILRRRFVAASATLTLVCAIHPLIGVTGLAIIGVFVLLRHPWAWALAGLSVVAIVLLAFSGVEPFGRILRQFDPAWAAIVERRSSYAFLGHWSWIDWLRTCGAISALSAFCAVATNRERRLALSVIIVGVGGILAAYVGGDLAQNVLVVNVQPWRALWLVAVGANTSIALLIFRLPTSYVSRQLFLVGGALSALTDFLWAPGFVVPAVLLLGTAVLAAERRAGRPLPPRLATCVRICAAVGVALFGSFVVQQLQSSEAMPALERLALTVGALIALPVLGWAPAMLAVLVIGVVLALQLWSLDHRSAWQKFVETPGVPPTLADLKLGSNTYWEAGVELMWIKLRRPSYYSCAQGTGVMFYRDTAMEYDRRGLVIRRLNTEDFSENEREMCMIKPDPKQDGPKTRASLVDVCRLLPELDTLVIGRKVPTVSWRQWRAPAPRNVRQNFFSMRSISTFYAYDCAELRAAPL
jgi:hypothetical protein